MRHTVIHQFDPEHHVAGGIDGFIADLLRHAGPAHSFKVVGVTARGSAGALGKWRELDVGAERPIDFMPVAHVDRAAPRRLPHTLRLVAGVYRYRPDLSSDVVHFHRVETAAACGLLASAHRRVVFIHGPGRIPRERMGESFWRFAPRLYDLCEHRAIRQADKAFIMHHAKAMKMQERYTTVEHGANWYDASTFGLSAREAPAPTIGWVGRLDRVKDPLLAVDVFAKLAVRKVQFEAWIAGAGDLEDAVRRRLEQRKLHMVRLVGLLDPTALAAELAKTRVLLCTSCWEGIPRAVVEALACGVPVVSPDVGDVGRLVSAGAGIVVPDRTCESLSGALMRVLDTEIAAADVAATVAHLSAERVVPSLLARLDR